MAQYVYLDDEPIEKKPKERKRISMNIWRKSVSALMTLLLAFAITTTSIPKIGSYDLEEPISSEPPYASLVYWGGGDDSGGF